ncbi:hypothetical protein IE81DRAFT_338887 [Ceraceosorus guamensis]|uniref:Uncharacterized protein n=1 Tax=Ceraceosorus guamensis TaxID=1522189 RepID=A0A316W822_9BASI|nr:hypothetical protein IE81DRAFT_338887 [Ceraceosorus guamensis]PWN46037.1 hypothetical protein IE81DRAFT_338887 [Ceraceosorus guamensis]
MRNHRIWGQISQHDAELWQTAVAENVEIWHRTHEPRILAWYRRPKVRLEADWSEKARGVQEHWGMRLESLARLLQDATMSLYQQHNASTRAATPIAKAPAAAAIFAEVTRVVEEINVLTYSLLAHALIGPTVPWPLSTASSDTDPTRVEWKTGLLERCAGESLTANTSRTGGEGPTSSLWNAAILSTQKALCYMTIELFDETLSRRFEAARPEALDAQNTHDAGWLRRWRGRLDTLRSELEWSSWDTCPETCGADSFCYIPSWPLSMFMSAGPPPGPPPDDPGPGGPNSPSDGGSVGGCVQHRDGVESPEMHHKHTAQQHSGRPGAEKRLPHHPGARNGVLFWRHLVPRWALKMATSERGHPQNMYKEHAHSHRPIWKANEEREVPDGVDKDEYEEEESEDEDDDEEDQEEPARCIDWKEWSTRHASF